MIDWDDLRFFLAVGRHGSVRAAADRLGVNHATVLRRVAQLEGRLGTRLFDRLPAGYRLTEAGGEVLHLAEQMEQSSHALEGRVLGRDQAAGGLLRVTLPPLLAANLLMPDLADFARAHPAIEVALLSVDEPVNLTNREADVAIRVVYDRDALPAHLHGRQGPPLHGGVYAARAVLAGKPDGLRWVVKDNIGVPDWVGSGAVAAAGPPFHVTHADALLAAVRAGVGMATLPCFAGDADPALGRVPGAPLHQHGTVWLLTLGETRRTRRVRLFIDFMAGRLARHAPLLAGRTSPG